MKSYSRRELYAAGEALGDSSTVHKVGGGRIYGGGGSGGGGGPTTTTQVTSNIPEYARPYVENMLGSAQTQIYNDDMTTFRPYTPYSTNVNDYFAGFSPLQQQAQQAAYGLQTPEQIGAGSTLATAGGIGSLGLATNMAGAGQRYAQQATDPNAISAYMSPYQQQVTDYQKAQALRDYQIGQPMRQAKAVGQGAFGGSRQAIENAEAQRSLMSQLQGIEATGRQNAFQNAQQAQQYGANLGLQGQQAAMAGLGQAGQLGSTLGQLGTQQLAAQQGIIGTQAQMGAQQQQLEQSKINQAIQDYATAQQYPFMQLGMMNALLRGLPLQQATTQQYQAAPSALSQLGGLAATGIGTYGAMGGFKAGGGQIKEYAEGGDVKGYAGDDGSVVSGLDVIDKVSNELESLPTEELAKLAKTSSSETIREKAGAILAMRQAAQAQAPKKPAGIAAVPVPDTMFSAAGGGIVAFAGDDGSLVDEQRLKAEADAAAQDAAIKKPKAIAGVAPKEGKADLGGLGNVQRYIEGLKGMGFGQSTEEEKALRADLLKDKERAAKVGEMNPWLALAMGGAKTMAGKSQYALQNLGEGIEAGLGTYAKGEKDMAETLKGIRAGEIDINKLGATERNNLLHYALTGAVSEARTAEEAATRRQNAALTASKTQNDKINSLFSTMYSANLKSAQDKLGIDKVTDETRDEIARQTMMQVNKLLGAQGKKGLNLEAGGGGGGNIELPEGVKVKKVG
jgi:hypothetical protein